MNKKSYIDLLKTLQYGGKKSIKHLLSPINNNWYTISDSTAREGGNSKVYVDYSTFGLHIYGTLGAIQGLSKALVGFCIAKSDTIDIPERQNYRGIFFKAVFDPKINYLFQLRTTELQSQENYVAPIKYTNNNKIYIPLNKFELTYRGNTVSNTNPINTKKINSIGIQINRSNQTEPYYSKIPLKFNFTLLSDIYMK